LKAINLEAKLHLVFSLMVFLSISTRQLLHWLFTTEIPTVTIRISHFMGFFTSESTVEARFGPAMVFSLWRNKTRYPAAQKHLREMTIPCAHTPMAARRTCKCQCLCGCGRHDPSVELERQGTSDTRIQLNTRRLGRCTPSPRRQLHIESGTGRTEIPPKYPSWLPLRCRQSTKQRSCASALVMRVSIQPSPW
jgi:hypothetical protein